MTAGRKRKSKIQIDIASAYLAEEADDIKRLLTKKKELNSQNKQKRQNKNRKF